MESRATTITKQMIIKKTKDKVATKAKYKSMITQRTKIRNIPMEETQEENTGWHHGGRQN